ncbi:MULTISPECIES: hypothetical protein [unclassified Cryobacterium]|nr:MULTISPECIES: hypothetical protein [Cryobacterium]MEB0306848.1 hypothetical protein [Cryobacterium sp. 10I1]MEC5150578.1 hypothetical protein [Cryobacterium psychrotolerans]
MDAQARGAFGDLTIASAMIDHTVRHFDLTSLKYDGLPARQHEAIATTAR